VFRPTGFAELAGKRVGIFGYGLEVARRDDESRTSRRRSWWWTTLRLGLGLIVSSEGGLEALLGCDVVLKSPGYRVDARTSSTRTSRCHGHVITEPLAHDIDRSRW